MQRRALRSLAAAVAAVAVAGCSTVTLTQRTERKISSAPEYEEVQQFFFWGLVGEHAIDVKRVCGSEDALQMQTQYTFIDGLLGFVTLGIYAPRTAKVWCG